MGHCGPGVWSFRHGRVVDEEAMGNPALSKSMTGAASVFLHALIGREDQGNMAIN